MLHRLSLAWQTASPAERAWAAVALACLLACAALVLSLRACDAPAEPDPVEETHTDATVGRLTDDVGRTGDAIGSADSALTETTGRLRRADSLLSAPLTPEPVGSDADALRAIRD